MKKKWTPAARKAFALKMKRARAAKGGRRRHKNPGGGMRLRYLPANMAWAFHFGAGLDARPTSMGDYGTFFRSRKEAVEAAKNQGLKVSRSGIVSTLRATNPHRRRRRNPTKAQVKAAAGRIAKAAARAAWAGTKRTARFTGRVGAAGAKAAAAEVKASICRQRAKNPKNKGFEVRMGTRKKRKLVWTAQTRADAIHVAKVYARAYPRKVISVHAEK